MIEIDIRAGKHGIVCMVCRIELINRIVAIVEMNVPPEIALRCYTTLFSSNCCTYIELRTRTSGKPRETYYWLAYRIVLLGKAEILA